MNELFKLLLDATLTLPALEVSLLLTILTLCLVFRYSRIGLVTAYLFTYRWGWLVFIELGSVFLTSYLIFGSIVAILTVVNMLRSPAQGDD